MSGWLQWMSEIRMLEIWKAMKSVLEVFEILDIFLHTKSRQARLSKIWMLFYIKALINWFLFRFWSNRCPNFKHHCKSGQLWCVQNLDYTGFWAFTVLLNWGLISILSSHLHSQPPSTYNWYLFEVRGKDRWKTLSKGLQKIE